MAAPPTRVDEDLYDSARLFGELSSRSAAQQLAHWARIGRELETGGSVSFQEILDVLVGARDYDALDSRAQAIVRAEWAEAMKRRRKALNLAREFQQQGRPYVELDDEGNVVRHEPDGSTKPVAPPAKKRTRPRVG